MNRPESLHKVVSRRSPTEVPADAHFTGMVKSRGQRNRLREAGPIDCRVSVQAFLVEDHRNSQPGVLHKELLDGICSFRHLARIQTLARVTRTSDLAKPIAVFERL